MKLLEAIQKFSEWKYLRVRPNTIYGYDGHLRHFCVFLKNPDIENIKLEQVVDYLNWYGKMGFRGSSLEKYGLAIKEFLEFYYKQNYQVVDPDLVPIPKIFDRALPRVASDEDFQKLLGVIPKNSTAYYNIRNRVILWLLYDTGARVSEVSGLYLRDIKHKEAIIRTGKNNNDMPFRKIFWTDQCQTELERWLKKRKELLGKINFLEESDNNFLFLSVNGGFCGNGKIGRRMDIEAVGQFMRNLSNKAGLPYNLNPHSFRHRMGHEMVKRGASANIVSQILGHRSLDSSRIYVSLSAPELGKIYHKIFGR